MADSFDHTANSEMEKKKGFDPYEDWGKSKPKMADESVGSTVGPMLPQPPYGGHGDIVEKIGGNRMETVYDESIASIVTAPVRAVGNVANKAATAVKDTGGKAIDKAKELGQSATTLSNKLTGKDKIDTIEDPYPNDSLSGTMRRLANEYGYTMGKLGALGRNSKTSNKNEARYKKRCNQIHKLYSVELKKERDPALKSQMASDYLKRANYYRKKASDMVRHQMITETYNETIQELINAGAIPANSTLLEESYFETPTVYPAELFTEGVNRDLHKAAREAVKEFNKCISAVRKNLRKKQYDEALASLTDAMKYRDQLEEEIKKFESSSKSNDVDNTFMSNILAFFMIDYSSMVKSLSKLDSMKNVIKRVSILRTALDDYDSYVKRAKETDQDGPAAVSYYNPIYRKSLTILKKIGETCTEVERAIKAEQITAKETIESADDQSWEITLTYLYENGVIDFDDYFDQYFTEARKPDDGIMDILKTLNQKGYKTKYSCTGHKDSGKHDRNKDGIVNGKLVSAARIQFDKDYNFPDPPKHWGWKSVEGADYLYVLPITAKAGMSDAEQHKAFDQWKSSYMGTLKTWVDALKPVSDTKEKIIDEPKKGDTAYDKEKDVLEHATYENAIDTKEYLDEAFAMLSIGLNY